jgi:hypothetical protein
MRPIGVARARVSPRSIHRKGHKRAECLLTRAPYKNRDGAVCLASQTVRYRREKGPNSLC